MFLSMHFIHQYSALTISPSLGSGAPNKAGRSSNNMDVILLYCCQNNIYKRIDIISPGESYLQRMLIKVHKLKLQYYLQHRYRHVWVREPVRCKKTPKGHSIELPRTTHQGEPSLVAYSCTKL